VAAYEIISVALETVSFLPNAVCGVSRCIGTRVDFVF
jgi:hypothetical protein